jgi:hypothetical protein
MLTRRTGGRRSRGPDFRHRRGFQISDKGREIDGILAACDDLALFRKPAFHALTAALTPQSIPRIEKALDRIAEQISQDPASTLLADELRDVTAQARAKPRVGSN